MDFISQIIDAETGEQFISVEEAGTVIGTDKVNLLLSSASVFPYYPTFIAIESISNKPGNEITFSREIAISACKHILFKSVEVNGVATLQNIMDRVNSEITCPETMAHVTIINGNRITYAIYLLYDYKIASKMPVPHEIFPFLILFNRTYHSFTTSDTFLKLEDIQQHITEQKPNINEPLEPANTIKEINRKEAHLTYNGALTVIKGTGVCYITRLLLSPCGEAISISELRRHSSGLDVSPLDHDEAEKEASSEIDEEYRKIEVTKKDKKVHKQGVAEIQNEIKTLNSMRGELKDPVEIENLRKEVTEAEKRYKALEKWLYTEFRATVTTKGEVIYGKLQHESDGTSTKKIKEIGYKNQIDSVRSAIKYIIESVPDADLRKHLSDSFTYGKDLKYMPHKNVTWKLI